jgi:hypothetical protein
MPRTTLFAGLSGMDGTCFGELPLVPDPSDPHPVPRDGDGRRATARTQIVEQDAAAGRSTGWVSVNPGETSRMETRNSLRSL